MDWFSCFSSHKKTTVIQAHKPVDAKNLSKSKKNIYFSLSQKLIRDLNRKGNQRRTKRIDTKIDQQNTPSKINFFLICSRFYIHLRFSTKIIRKHSIPQNLKIRLPIITLTMHQKEDSIHRSKFSFIIKRSNKKLQKNKINYL